MLMMFLMYQWRNILFGTLLSVLIVLWVASAAGTGSMTLSPTTGSIGMRCIYPINFFVNIDSISTKAIDMKILYDTGVMQFTWASTGTLLTGSYLYPPRTWTTSVATNLGWKSYPIWSPYYYFNRTSLTNALNSPGDLLFYTWYFQTLTNTFTWYVDFYYSWAWNGDDSNIQSGVSNWFVDILSAVNSGYYAFVARPCILDTDAPLFTGYDSGLNVSYLSGLRFTIYDFTGSRQSWYNDTVHYRWSGAVNGPLTWYVPASDTSTGIDNQYGVNSGSIRVFLSWTALGGGVFTGEGIYSGATLVYTSFTLQSLNNSNLFSCTWMSTSIDKWYYLTWNRNVRWYDCQITSTGLMSMSGVRLNANQTLLVIITGADNMNFNNSVNTWFTVFSITFTGIDNMPPYILASTYEWTGAFTWSAPNNFNSTGGWPLFSSAVKSGWTLWTRNNIELHLTGSEKIIISNVIWFSGTDLNVYISGGNWYSWINQVLIFTGNMTGYVSFMDIAAPGMSANNGQTFASGANRYVDTFNIDVFWIDRISPVVTGSIALTGINGQINYAYLTLTGSATGNAESIKDDEFTITEFTGVGGAGTGPMLTLATWYSIGTTGGTYSLYHTGVRFDNNWSGYVLFRDRAGNTGSMFVNFTGVLPSSVFVMKAFPSDRANYTGMIARFIIVSWFVSTSIDPPQWTWSVVLSWIVKFSLTGIYSFSYSFSSNSVYAIMVEWQSHLAQVITWLTITWATTFDFTNLPWRIKTWLQIAWDLSVFENWQTILTTWSQKDWLITTADLWVIVSWLNLWGFKVYTWGFHVYTWWAGKTELTSPESARLGLAAYHPADLNNDGDVGAPDLSKIITYIWYWPFAIQSYTTRQYNNSRFYDQLDY